MIGRVLLLLLLLSASPGFAADASAITLSGGLKAGPYAVGFKVVRAYDRSRPPLLTDEAGRSLAATAGRAMQIAIWYPAAARGRPLTLRDYVLLNGLQIDFRAPGPERRRATLDMFAARLRMRGAAPGRIDAVLNAPMLSSSGAPPARGRFPLVIYAHVEPCLSAVTAEYLASHGYVVAVIPWKGSFAYELDVAVTGVETQARDIAFVAAHLRQATMVDSRQIAVIGMSFGALGASALQMQDHRIGGIVSLDGGIGSPTVRLLQAGPYYAVQAMNRPLLHLYGPEEDGVDLAWFDDIRYADRFLVPFPGARHEDFVATPMLDVALGLTLRGNPHQMVFEAVNRDALSFLEGPVFGTGQGFAPPRLEHRLPAPAPPTLADLKLLFERSGAEGIQAEIERRRPTDPQPVSAQILGDLTSWLLQKKDWASAGSIAELRRDLYPDSATAVFVVGLVAERRGDLSQARRLYEEAADKLARDFDPGLDSLRRRQISRAAGRS